MCHFGTFVLEKGVSLRCQMPEVRRSWGYTRDDISALRCFRPYKTCYRLTRHEVIEWCINHCSARRIGYHDATTISVKLWSWVKDCLLKFSDKLNSRLHAWGCHGASQTRFRLCFGSYWWSLVWGSGHIWPSCLRVYHPCLQEVTHFRFFMLCSRMLPVWFLIVAKIDHSKDHAKVRMYTRAFVDWSICELMVTPSKCWLLFENTIYSLWYLIL